LLAEGSKLWADSRHWRNFLFFHETF